MAESQPEIQSRLADADIRADEQGRALAFLLALIAMGGSIGFFAVGNTPGGIVLLSMPVVMLVRSVIAAARR